LALSPREYVSRDALKRNGRQLTSEVNIVGVDVITKLRGSGGREWLWARSGLPFLAADRKMSSMADHLAGSIWHPFNTADLDWWYDIVV